MALQMAELGVLLIAAVLLLTSAAWHIRERASLHDPKMVRAIWGDVLTAASLAGYVVVRLAEGLPLYASQLPLLTAFVGLTLSGSHVCIWNNRERNTWFSGFLQGVSVTLFVAVALLVFTSMR